MVSQVNIRRTQTKYILMRHWLFIDFLMRKKSSVGKFCSAVFCHFHIIALNVSNVFSKFNSPKQNTENLKGY